MTGSIGAHLKEAREKKAVTLDDVHARLKIHPRVLQLLEEDKFDKLPSPLYAKSFLRSYAEFLELNADELLEAYEKDKKKDPEQTIYIRPAEAGLQKGLHPFYIAAGAFAGVALVVVLIGRPAVKAVQGWASSHKAAPARTLKPGEVPASSVLNAKIAPGRELWLNTPDQRNFPKINAKTPVTLEIRALDAVWLRISADGAIVYQGILKKGDSNKWNAKDSLEIWTGNASNMALSVNKTALGSPGKGVVKRMIVSREGIRIASSGAR